MQAQGRVFFNATQQGVSVSLQVETAILTLLGWRKVLRVWHGLICLDD